MPRQKPKPSTATQRADEALERVAPEGRTPARRTLAFLLEGSHDAAGATPQAESDTVPAALQEQPVPEVTPPNPTLGGVTPPNPSNPISPERDFNKRANSLDRVALPAGLFPGSSKKLYDALYIRTRGAVVPKKSIRATKRELSDWSGIRNVKTIDAHLRYLTAIGLLVSQWERGRNDGCLYEIVLPEETTGLSFNRGVSESNSPSGGGSPHLTPPDVGSPQNLVGGSPQKLGLPHLTYVPLESGSYEESKTFIKTIENNDDDEAFADLIAALKQSSINITGKAPSSAERQRWRQLGELLAAELEIAASRTTVSSVPAFLTTHLRRRLFKTDAGQIDREAAEAHEGQKADEQAQQERRRHLDGEQLQQQVNKMVELMRRGRSMQELDEELAAGFQPVQWHMIRGMALAQLKVGGGDAKREEEQGK